MQDYCNGTTIRNSCGVGSCCNGTGTGDIFSVIFTGDNVAVRCCDNYMPLEVANASCIGLNDVHNTLNCTPLVETTIPETTTLLLASTSSNSTVSSFTSLSPTASDSTILSSAMNISTNSQLLMTTTDRNVENTTRQQAGSTGQRIEPHHSTCLHI